MGYAAGACAHERGFADHGGRPKSIAASPNCRRRFMSARAFVSGTASSALFQKLGIDRRARRRRLVRFPDEAYFMMLDPKTFNRAAILYAWGHDNAELWRRFPEYRDTPIVEAGNPRMDMLRPELRDFYATDVADLHRRFGRFVLFNSNFSVVNHFIPGFQRFRVAGHAEPNKSDEIKTGISSQGSLVRSIPAPARLEPRSTVHLSYPPAPPKIPNRNAAQFCRTHAYEGPPPHG
jgi:hypothetical protein